LFNAGNQGILAVEDDLVVEAFDDRFDGVVVHKDSGDTIHLPCDPDFNLPAVTMDMCAFPAIVHEPVAGIEVHQFVNPGIHQYWYAG
jgi:hypothetical protein